MTALLNGHVPVHVVSALAGHEDLATTQKYAEVLNADKEAAGGVLGRAHETGQEQRDAKLAPEQPRAAAQRAKKSKRGSVLRSRALERARQRGNTLETEPGKATRSRTAAICSAIFFGQGLMAVGVGADSGASSSSPVGSAAWIAAF